MPNRLLREGICTSDAINSLTTEEEVLFYRLLVVVDDFGYMDARPAIVKAECFPLRDTVIPAKVEAWLVALAGAGLIVRYQSGGKPYLAIAKWEHRIRSRQKYPGPQDDGSTPIGSDPNNPVSTMPHVVSSPLTDRVQVSADCGLGKGKGKGKGALNTISFNAELNRFENIDDSQINLWKSAYPATNIDIELNKAVVWLKANPTKVKSNYNKFLSGWLSRCQDSGGTRSNQPKQTTQDIMRFAK